jgi:hypothetical protein
MGANTRELVGRRGKNEPPARPEDAAEAGSRDGFHDFAEFWFLAGGGDSATKGMHTGGWLLDVLRIEANFL